MQIQPEKTLYKNRSEREIDHNYAVRTRSTAIYELARVNLTSKWKILKFLMLATTISQKR